MTHNRKFTAPIFILILLAFFSIPTNAGDCMRLCNLSFMKTATAKDIQEEIAKGADIEARNQSRRHLSA